MRLAQGADVSLLRSVGSRFNTISCGTAAVSEIVAQISGTHLTFKRFMMLS